MLVLCESVRPIICLLLPGLVSWPSAFQAVNGTELSIECVLASYKDAPPVKAFLQLNGKSIPKESEDYTVSELFHS